MKDRRLAEVELLRAEYGTVTHDAEGTYVIIHNFPVPPGWNIGTVDVLIVIPGGYPNAPPDNMHVAAGLRLSNQAQPGAFTPNGLDHAGRMWDTFSWHLDSAEEWKPADEIRSGSNLLDYARAYEKRLQEAS